MGAVGGMADPRMHASNYIYNGPSVLARTSPQGVVWIYPLLRALTEHGPWSDNLFGLLCAVSEHEG